MLFSYLFDFKYLIDFNFVIYFNCFINLIIIGPTYIAGVQGDLGARTAVVVLDEGIETIVAIEIIGCRHEGRDANIVFTDRANPPDLLGVRVVVYLLHFF